MQNFEKIEAWIEPWTTALLKKDLSSATLREYTRDVRQFLHWLLKSGGGFTHPKNVGMTTARQYRDFLIVEHKKASTVNRRTHSISAFLSYLDVPEKENPFRNLKQISIVRGAPKSLDRNEWNEVRRCAENLRGKDYGLSLAMISLLRHAGLRVSELVALKLRDIEINEKSGKVFVRKGKGLKERMVPLNLDARDGLKLWLETGRKTFLNKVTKRLQAAGRTIPDWVDSDFVFVGQRGVFRVRGVGVITAKLGKLAEFKETLGTHRFRHTFARAALDPQGYSLKRQPVPLTALKQMLGHSRIETTSIYSEFEHKDHARFLEEEGEEL